MQTFGIERFNDQEIPAEFQPQNIYSAPNFEERCEQFKTWLAERKIYYYARPREDFFVFEAYELAHAAGCTHLLLEDLS